MYSDLEKFLIRTLALISITLFLAYGFDAESQIIHHSAKTSEKWMEEVKASKKGSLRLASHLAGCAGFYRASAHFQKSLERETALQKDLLRTGDEALAASKLFWLAGLARDVNKLSDEEFNSAQSMNKVSEAAELTYSVSFYSKAGADIIDRKMSECNETLDLQKSVLLEFVVKQQNK